MISTVTLQNFRCFDIQRFALEKITYIHGNNGTGKTAILEAISLVNGQNSFRSKTMDTLIKNGDGIFEVMLETTYGSVFIQHDSQKKTITLDGDKATSQQLKNLFHPVLFAPQYELSLATPSSIRVFLDKLASYLFPEHDKLLNKCRELLSERLKILLTSNNSTWLSSIEMQIAQNFTIVCYNRLFLVQKLNTLLEEFAPNSTLEINEKFTNLLQEGRTFSYIEKYIVDSLANSRNFDRMHNKNSISVNSTEYKVFFRNQRIDFCSSGQQKLMGAILTLAISCYLTKSGKNTITLLDDITAKIDTPNQEYLHDIIISTNSQTIITSIETPSWKDIHPICL